MSADPEVVRDALASLADLPELLAAQDAELDRLRRVAEHAEANRIRLRDLEASLHGLVRAAQALARQHGPNRTPGCRDCAVITALEAYDQARGQGSGSGA